MFTCIACKELAIKCIESKQYLIAIKLDAVKAFDRLWRDVLFFKVKLKVNFLSLVILMKVYYDVLQGVGPLLTCEKKHAVITYVKSVFSKLINKL